MSKYRNDNIRNESCELYGAEGVTIFFLHIHNIKDMRVVNEQRQ